MFKWIVTAATLLAMAYVNVVYAVMLFDRDRRGPPVKRKFGPFRYTDGTIRSPTMLDGLSWWTPIYMSVLFNVFFVSMLAAVWTDAFFDLLFSNDWGLLAVVSPCIPTMMAVPAGLLIAWRWPYRKNRETHEDCLRS